MRDIEIIAKALLDARAELTRDRNWPPIEADCEAVEPDPESPPIS
jgi:hypothetical protein